MIEHKTKQALHFTLNWKASLLIVLLLPCLVFLGFWQLSRGVEKQELNALFELRKKQPPVLIRELSTTQDLRYQQVRLRGEFVNNRVVLLDNKIYRGQFGYEVISLFKLINSELRVLVNRGWVAGDNSRRTLPDIKYISEEVELIGEIHVPQGTLLTLGQQSMQGWPRVVQSVDINALAEQLKNDIFPYIVRIGASEVGAYQANWVVVNVQPDKHIAYAFQWFAMAVTLLIIALLANTNLWALLIKQREK